jgi:hypothetical protein
MPVLIAPPPKDTQFVDKTGRITVPWVAWLDTLTAAGAIIQNIVIQQAFTDSSSVDQSNAGLLDTALDVVSLGAAVDAGAVNALRAELAELRALLAAGDANTWRADLDELRALLVAGEPSPLGALGAAAFLSLPVPVASGGTGAITAPLALTSLGAAASGANADITSLAAIGAGGIASAGAITGTLGGWISYTVTPGAASPMAAATAASAVNTAQYIRDGPSVRFSLAWIVTTTGSPSNSITLTAPLAAAAAAAAVAPVTCDISLNGGSSYAPGFAYLTPASATFVVQLSGGGNFPIAAASIVITLSGTYRVA